MEKSSSFCYGGAMKRLVMIFILWAGMIGSAVAGGPPVYDYLPKSIGMDFSTAPKPHMPVPGGEWHVVSGDGTIYPDIINYCDPDTSPECLAHLYVACWAWTTLETTETNKVRLAPICKEAGVTGGFFFQLRNHFESDIKRPSMLYYYKLDTWNLKEMGYYFWDYHYPPTSLKDFPFEKNTDPDEWQGEQAIDIYAGYCRPDDACLAKGGYYTLVESDKSCPLTYCKGYGFDEREEIDYFNGNGIFVYPTASIGFPFYEIEKGIKYTLVNYLPKLQGNYRYSIPEAPARWLPGHPDSAWTALGVSYADQGYDKRLEKPKPKFENPEMAFFDSIVDENNNVLLDKDDRHSDYDTTQAMIAINDERFGCIETEFRAKRTRPPSYQLSAHLESFAGYSLSWGYAFEEKNRYVSFSGCLFWRFCSNSGHYLVDVVDKHIAIMTKTLYRILNKEKHEDGKPIYDDKFYRAIFLLPDTPEEFIQKALYFASEYDYDVYRDIEVFFIDCRKSDKIESNIATHNLFPPPN